MKYGAMNFPVIPVLEELEAISMMRFDYMELTLDPPQAHYRVIERQAEALLKSLDQYGMSLVCHLPTFVSTADLTDSIRRASLEETLKSLELAAELRAMKAVLHPSIIRGMGVFVMDRARENAMNSLEIIVKKSDELGMHLCLENMFPQSNSLVDPDDFVEVFDRFPSLKMTLDTGHANMESKGSYKIIEFIERFADRIFHVHANDNLGKEDNHLPLGTGTIDFPRVVKALKEAGYQETVTLEVFSRDRDYLSMSRDKIASMFKDL